MKSKTFIKIFFTIFTLLGLLSIHPSLSFAQDCDGAVCGEVVGNEGSLVVEYGITATTEGTDKTTAIGVYGVGTINELDNSGGYTISAEATLDSEDEVVHTYSFGVKAYAIDELTNSGTISATATSNAEEGYAYAEAHGVHVDSDINKLINSGTISATAISNGYDAKSVAIGVSDWTWDSINELNNSGKISAEAMATAMDGDAYADASGVSAWSGDGYIGSLTNSGTISATATAEGYYSAEAYAYGVRAYEINTLNNSGTISATAKAKATDLESYIEYVEAYGVWAREINNLFNSGTISAYAIGEASDVSGYAFGVCNDGGNINNLENSGTISAYIEGKGGYTEVYAYGVAAYGGDNIMDLKNSGIIKATAIATSSDNNAYAYAYGIYADDIYKVTNSGTISAFAKSTGNLAAYAKAYGIFSSDIYEPLTNYGTIEAICHSIGTAWYSNYSEAYGVYAGHIEELKNYGTIRSKAIAEFSNENETVEIISSAVYTGMPLTLVNLENYDTIEAIAEAKGTVAKYVDIYASAIDTGFGYTQNIYNEGTIRTTVTTEYKDSKIVAYGVSTNGNSDGDPSTITNKGTISVIVNAPSDSYPTKINIAGIKIGGGNVTLSNYGSINIESSVKGVKAHSLWIHGSGNVTLQDKFAITFGTPGIEPSVDSSTNLDQRPIYLASGTLDLNNTVLIARADSRNLKLGEKYYLIYNDEGTVNGQWGGLEKGYSNPNFNVSWAGEDLGENSAVVFTYEPKTSATTPAVGGMAGAPIMINAVVGLIIFSDHLHPFLIGESKFNPIMFASSAVSDVPVRTDTKYSKGLWFMPVYTKTKAKDLGFDADSYGFSFGLGGDLASNLYGGIFAGYLRNNLDFKVREAVDEDQDLFFGGLGFLYSPKPWYGRFLTYAYTAEHDYTGRTGLNYDLSEKANYHSKGFYTELTAGYIFGDKIKFSPEVGLSYGYYKTKSFKTTVSLNPSLERYYEPDSLDVFKAIAGFNVKADCNNTQLFGGFRLEQALGDNDISVINYMPGQPKYKLEKSVADTTAVIHVGLSHNLSKQISFELGARADINGDYKAYTGRGVLKIAF